MLTIRKSEERGHEDHGWLFAKHSFSFANYYDPKNMGFRNLRVINEDVVAPGMGFGTHGHRDMEIVTYILDGALEHKDSLGNGSVLRPGLMQRMSAGTGVRHSEFNPSKVNPTHLLQIWILPKAQGIAPGYEEKAFADAEKQGRLRLLASSDGRDGSLSIAADAAIYASLLGEGERVKHEYAAGRGGWLQLARGGVRVTAGVGEPVELAAGDAVAIEGEASVAIEGLEGEEQAEFLLFDLGE